MGSRKGRRYLVLVIIDMQECYRDEMQAQHQKFDRFLKKLERKFANLREKQQPVVNLISPWEGNTFYEILHIIGEYNRTYYCHKDKFDGSAEILEECRRRKAKPKQVELCGLYTDVCVLDTWLGLKERDVNVLPVDPTMTFKSSFRVWRKVEKFPDGFLKKKRETTSCHGLIQP
jgi:nicotinamidase-related amidase